MEGDFIVNISNYSFDDTQGRKKSIRIKPIYIIIIVILVVILISLIVLFIGLKKEAENEVTTEEVTTENLEESDTFVDYFESSFSDLYGYTVEIYISGENNDYSYLGEFLGDYFSRSGINEDVYISGKVYGSGATFAIYKGAEDYDSDGPFIGVAINEEGVFANCYFLGDIAYPNEEDAEKRYAMETALVKQVKIADGLSDGYEIMESLVTALRNSSENFVFGKSKNGYYAVEIPEGTLVAEEDNPLQHIINGLHGSYVMEINTIEDEEGLIRTTISAEGSDISFVVNTLGFEFYIMEYDTPYEYVSVDEYKTSIGEQ